MAAATPPCSCRCAGPVDDRGVGACNAWLPASCPPRRALAALLPMPLLIRRNAAFVNQLQRSVDQVGAVCAHHLVLLLLLLRQAKFPLRRHYAATSSSTRCFIFVAVGGLPSHASDR